MPALSLWSFLFHLSEVWEEVRTYLSGGVSTIMRTTQHSESSTRDRGDVLTGEELRDLLCRLHEQGSGAWNHDPAVPSLMEYVCEKYAALAARYGLDPWEAASAAFDVMRTRAAREARDPWAVVTHAVRITCIYEERAQGLLCSVHQARRPRFTGLHDPERFSARAFPLADDHPAFSTDMAADEDSVGHENTKLLVQSVIEHTIELVMLLGWPSDAARHSVERVCDCLEDAGSSEPSSMSLHARGCRSCTVCSAGRGHSAQLCQAEASSCGSCSVRQSRRCYRMTISFGRLRSLLPEPGGDRP